MVDAVVVGAGPNGLAAAITVARAGWSVVVIEARETVGGGTRTEELTLPGFRHDVCSAIHPGGRASPFFRDLPLADHGLEWLLPEVMVAHPLDDGTAGVMLQGVDETAAGLGTDARAYRRIFGPLVKNWSAIENNVLGPLQRAPRHPLAMASFGLRALPPATLVARMFKTPQAAGLWGGIAAHAFLPLEHAVTSGAAALLGTTGHVAGWPVARGGSQAIADALASYLRSLGGTIETGSPVTSLADLPPALAVFLDVAPRNAVAIAGDRIPHRHRRKLNRYRYGEAAFKVDWALSGPVPWKNDAARRAGTVHVAGTIAEVATAERAVFEGRVPERPFMLVGQQSIVDDTRAPAGQHTLWSYCHVPNGCTVDMTDAMERQLERFAPGFRDLVLARSVKPPAAIEAGNANCIGGDIAGGATDKLQLVLRPALRYDPYRIPGTDLYLCSASTPPGGGVHGMCGYWAAQSALRRRG
ncbi:MAG: NAD(P)/FAD-dependent oxidoreductase [Actinobacteria bacterium]|nr:NAD(P)/FAD-dependent oxidoreductase [Actinomycetota bacterium]